VDDEVLDQLEEGIDLQQMLVLIPHLAIIEKIQAKGSKGQIHRYGRA
jgi:hypothetical protein